MEGRIEDAKKLYRQIQIYISYFNIENRRVRVRLLFDIYDLGITFVSYSLIAYHEKLDFFAIFTLYALIINALSGGMLFLRFLELLEGAAKDFKGQLLYNIRKTHTQHQLVYNIKFVASLQPVKYYRGDIVIEQGLSLGILNKNVDNIIFLLVQPKTVNKSFEK